MRIPAFWDTSSLVPLCVRQAITPSVLAFYKIHDAAVWWATPVEIASAISRLLRTKQIDSNDWSKASKTAARLADSWSVIQPLEAVRAKSIKLVERYDLRAADSLQLAAALEWCAGIPHGRVFLTADKRLREAALLSGFDAKPL